LTGVFFNEDGGRGQHVIATANMPHLDIVIGICGILVVLGVFVEDPSGLV
jgi:hypothetical protein